MSFPLLGASTRPTSVSTHAPKSDAQREFPSLPSSSGPCTPTMPQDRLEDQLCAHLIKKGKMNSQFAWTGAWSKTVAQFGKDTDKHKAFVKRIYEKILPAHTIQGTQNTFFSQFHTANLFNALEMHLAAAGIYIENILLIGSAVPWCFYPYLDEIAHDLEIEKETPLYYYLSSILLREFSDLDWRIILKQNITLTNQQLKETIQFALDTVVAFIGACCKPQPFPPEFIRQNNGLVNYCICVDDKQPVQGQKTNQFGIVSYKPADGKKVDITIGYSFQQLHFATQDAAQISLKQLINFSDRGMPSLLNSVQLLPSLAHRFAKIIHLPDIPNLDPFTSLPLLLSYYIKGHRSPTPAQNQSLLNSFLDRAESIVQSSQNQEDHQEPYTKVLNRSSNHSPTPAWISILIEGIKKTSFTHNDYDPAAYFFMLLQVMPLLLENPRSKEQALLIFATAMEDLKIKRPGEQVTPKEQISSPIVKALVECACKEPNHYQALIAALQLFSFLQLSTKGATTPTFSFDFQPFLTSHNQTTHIKVIAQNFHLFLDTSLPQALRHLNEGWTKEIETLVQMLKNKILTSYDFHKDSPVGRCTSLIPAHHLKGVECKPASPLAAQLVTTLELALMAFGGPTVRSIPDLLRMGKNGYQQIQLLDSCVRSIPKDEGATESLLIKLRELIRKSPQTHSDHLWILAHAAFPEKCPKALELWKTTRSSNPSGELFDFDRELFSILKETRRDVALQMCIELLALGAPLQACMELIDSLVVQSKANANNKLPLDPLWNRNWQRLFETLFARLTKNPQERMPKGTIDQYRIVVECLNSSNQRLYIEHLIPLVLKSFLAQEDHPQIEAFWIAGIKLFLSANLHAVVELLLKRARTLKVFEGAHSTEYQQFILELLALHEKCPTSLELALATPFDSTHAPLAYQAIAEYAQKIKQLSSEQIDFVIRFFKSQVFVKTAEQQKAQTRECFVNLTERMRGHPFFKGCIFDIFKQISLQTPPTSPDIYYGYLHTSGYMRNTVNRRIYVPINRFIFKSLASQDFHKEALDLWEQMRSHLDSVTLDDVKRLLQCLEKAPHVKIYRECVQLITQFIQKNEWEEWEPLFYNILANSPPEITVEVLSMVSTVLASKHMVQKKGKPPFSREKLLNNLMANCARLGNSIRCIELSLQLIDETTPKPSILAWLPALASVIHESTTLPTLVVAKQDLLLASMPPERVMTFFTILRACIHLQVKVSHVETFFPLFVQLLTTTKNDPEFGTAAADFFFALESKKFLANIPDGEQIEAVSQLIGCTPPNCLTRLVDAFIRITDKNPSEWKEQKTHKRCQQWLQKAQSTIAPWFPLFKKLDPWDEEGWKTAEMCKVIHLIIREGNEQPFEFRIRLVNQFWEPLKEHISHEILARTLHILILENQTKQQETAALLNKLTDLKELSASFCLEIFESFIQQGKEKKASTAAKSASSSQKPSDEEAGPTSNTPAERRRFVFAITWRNLVCGNRLRKEGESRAITKLLKFTLEPSQNALVVDEEEVKFFASRAGDLCSFLKTLKGGDQVGLVNKLLWLIATGLRKRLPEDPETLPLWNGFISSIKKELNISQSASKLVSIETTIKKLSIIFLLRQGNSEEALKKLGPTDLLLDLSSDKLPPEQEILLLSDEVNTILKEVSAPVRMSYLAHRFARLGVLIQECQKIHSALDKPVLSESFLNLLNFQGMTGISLIEYLDILQLLFANSPLTLLGLTLLQTLETRVLNEDETKKLNSVIESIQGENVDIGKLQAAFFKWRSASTFSSWKKPFIRHIQGEHTQLIQNLSQAIQLPLKKPQDLFNHGNALEKIIQKQGREVSVHLEKLEQTLQLFVGMRDVEKILLQLHAETLERCKIPLPLTTFAYHLSNLANVLEESMQSNPATAQDNHPQLLFLFNALTTKLGSYANDEGMNETQRLIVCNLIHCILKVFKDPSFTSKETSLQLLGFCAKTLFFYNDTNADEMRALISFVSSHPIAAYIPNQWTFQQIFFYAHAAPRAAFDLSKFTSAEISLYLTAYFRTLEPVRAVEIKSFSLAIQYLAPVDCSAPFSQHPDNHPFHQMVFVRNKLLAFINDSELYVVQWIKLTTLLLQCCATGMDVKNCLYIKNTVEGFLHPQIVNHLDAPEKDRWKKLVSQIIRIIYNQNFLNELLKLKQFEIFKSLKQAIAPPPTHVFDCIEATAREQAQKILASAEKTVDAGLLK